jgi:peptidoglycan/LPS O-acetylase OafA/YrhL
MRSIRINLSPRVVSGQRIDAIDELKGLAIALIILYHGEGIIGYPNVVHGEIGVDIFLILSGFALAMSSVETPIREFLLRRFARIYPAYWLALGLFLWMQRRLFGATYSWDNIFQHIAGVHGFSRPEYFSAISEPFWFVSLILAAYLVFACIRRRLDNLSLVIAVAGALTLLATILYQVNHHDGGLISLAVRIPSFFVGIIAGRLLCAGTAELRFNLLFGLGLLCFYFQTFFRSTADNYTLPAVGIVATWLGLRHVLAGFYQGRVFLAAFSLLGLVSYEVFLFHLPLIRDLNTYFYAHVLNNIAPSHAQLLRGILAGLGITLAISVVVHTALNWLWSQFRFRSDHLKAGIQR